MRRSCRWVAIVAFLDLWFVEATEEDGVGVVCWMISTAKDWRLGDCGGREVEDRGLMLAS